MAIPSLHMKIISRKEGQSAVASAAYRSGEALHDEREDKTFDYTRKEDILYTEIIAPNHAPEWVQDRERLWNEAEKAERYKNAQLARDVLIALPRELTFEQNLKLVKEYVDKQFVSRGMIADLAVHESDASDGGKNPHAHIMLTMRDIDQDGFAKKKNRTWNSKTLLFDCREAWEIHMNKALEEAGSDSRIRMTSYEKQGIEKEPQKHIGYKAWNIEKKGIQTDKGNHNRKVKQTNIVRDMVKHRQDDPVFPIKPLPRQGIIRRHYHTMRGLMHGAIQNIRQGGLTYALQGHEERWIEEAPESNISLHRETVKGLMHNQQPGTITERTEQQTRLMSWTKLTLAAIAKTIGRKNSKALSWTEKEKQRQEQEQEGPEHER